MAIDTFDVPEIHSLSDCPEDLAFSPIVGFVDMVLTMLLTNSPALLHAESKGEDPALPVDWFLKPQVRDLIDQKKPVAVSECRSHFRASLARFGHQYMNGQLYNGFSMIFLRQKSTTYRTYIYMSNGGLPGFWIRIYATLS